MLKKSEREVTRASCHLVEVNLHAFLAPTASLCELPTADTTNSVEDTAADCGEINLVKSSELGLDLALQSSSSPATAQVSYNSSLGETVSFMLKGGSVFGTVGSRRGRGYYYNLEPCMGIKNCHLWLQIKKKPII